MSNIKFSVCIEMIFSDLPLLERISAVAEAGYPAVEFWGWRGKDMDAIASEGPIASREVRPESGRILCRIQRRAVQPRGDKGLGAGRRRLN